LGKGIIALSTFVEMTGKAGEWQRSPRAT